MISYFCKVTSLKNLLSHRPKAQVSTLLILMMVTIVVFVMITANIGEVSLKATSLANAADSAVLSLGSQLATRSRAIWESNDSQVEQCVRGGWFMALLSLILTPIGYGIFMGITGGYSGNESFSDGFKQGFKDGIYAGAKVIAGALTGAFWGFVFGNLPGAVIGFVIGGIIATVSLMYEKENEFKDRAAAIETANKQLSGMPEYDRLREGVFFQALSGLNNDPKKEVDINDADGDGDKLEKIPRFFYLWDQRVEVYDSIVSWLEDIINNFVNGSLANFESFLKSEFTDLPYVNSDGTTRIAPFYRQEIDGQDGPLINLMRDLYENDKNHPTVNLGSGKMSLIYEPGPDLTTLQNWEANDCDPDTDPSCVPPQYYDEVDTVIAEMKDFLATAADVRAQGIKDLALTFETWFPRFYQQDDTGNPILDDSNYYGMFNTMINGSAIPPPYGISYWVTLLDEKRVAYDNLPRLPLIQARDADGNLLWQKDGALVRDAGGKLIPIYGYRYDNSGYRQELQQLLDDTLPDRTFLYETDGVSTGEPAYVYDWSANTPEVFYFEELTWQITDGWLSGEINDLNNLITQIQAFMGASYDTYNAMLGAYAALSTNLDTATLSGYNPIYYTWPDSAGDHTLKVEVGNYQLATITSKKKGKWYNRKYCSTVVNYSDDGTRCWVEITRIDPANKNVQSGKAALGRWNPFATGEDKIIRRGKASYDYGNVALSGIK